MVYEFVRYSCVFKGRQYVQDISCIQEQPGARLEKDGRFNQATAGLPLFSPPFTVNLRCP
jgi:hypothetical protein